MLENLKKYIGIKSLKLNKCCKTDVFKQIDTMFALLEEDTIRLEFGDDIVFYKDEIMKVLGEERERINNKNGFILPPVRCIDNQTLQENEIDIFLNGKKIDERFVIPKQENVQEEILNIINDLYEQHLYEIFSNEMVERYIGRAKSNNLKTVTEVCYNLASVEIKYILIDLLTHNKSIKNIGLIFEKISEKIYIYNSYKNNIEKFSKMLITSL